MHRPLFIAAFVLLLVPAQLSAQHGGGHASAGGHGGVAVHSGGNAFAGGRGAMAARGGGNAFVGGPAGGHVFSGTHSGSGFAGHPSEPGSSHRTFHPPLRRPVSSGDFNRFRGGHRDRRFRSRGFGNDCIGCGWGWGYAYPYLGGGIDPYWWWDSGSSYDEDREREIGLANEMNAQSLDEQRMRQQSDQDVYANSAPAHSREREEEPTQPAEPTVLVFRE